MTTLELQAEIAAATFKALGKLDRAPFRRALATFLGCQPSAGALKAFAEAHPDRWAQAVSVLGGLAGFERGLGPSINIYNFDKMSDAQLESRLGELERMAAAKDVTPPGAPVPLDVAYIEQDSESATVSAGVSLPSEVGTNPLNAQDIGQSAAAEPGPSDVLHSAQPAPTDAAQSAAVEIPTFITLKSKGF